MIRTVIYSGSTRRPTPKSDRASPRRRKFAVECKVEERRILKIINRFPAVAEAEMMPLKMALMSNAVSASSNKSNGVSMMHEALFDMFNAAINTTKLISSGGVLRLALKAMTVKSYHPFRKAAIKLTVNQM